MQRAEDHVIGEPNGQKPARPIATAKHEHSANNQKKADNANPDQLRVAPFRDAAWLEVISEGNATGRYEEPTEDRD